MQLLRCAALLIVGIFIIRNFFMDCSASINLMLKQEYNFKVNKQYSSKAKVRGQFGH